MKIGIITFWQTKDNYGQILQCFALQQKLKELGHSPYLIRYTHSEVKLTNWKLNIKTFLKGVIHIRKKDKDNKVYSPVIHDRKFDSFKETYITSSPEIYHSYQELKKTPPSADIYVVGSDQVWAKHLAFTENRAFFLDFGDKNVKRISYAASFAMLQYPTESKSALRKVLSKFDAISVREHSGVDICQSVGYNAKLVLDPTLLLKKDDYQRLFELKDNKGDNIFIYSLNISHPEEIHWSEIQQISKEKNWPVIITPSSGYILGGELFGVQNYEYCTIPQWLSRIMQSKIVITTSFHGIAFCIIFHTDFVYIPLTGTYAKGNNRVQDLLESLGCSNRIIHSSDNLSSMIKEPIDWDKIDQKLDLLRIDSINFLKRNIYEEQR